MKRTKILITLLLVMVMMVGGCGSSKSDSAKEDSKKAEKSEESSELVITEDDLKDVITGLDDHYVLQNAKNIDYLYGIEYDDSIIDQVVANTDQIQVENAGEYDITYTISVNVAGYLEYQEQTGETVKATDSDKDEIKDVEVKKKITVVDENEATKLADDNKVVWKDNNESVDKSTGEAVEVKEEQQPASIEKTKADTAKADSKKTEEKKSESNTKSEPAKKENNTNKKNDSKNTVASHTHSWVAITKNVHHDAVYETQPVYTTVTDYEDQPVYATKVVCGCGAVFDSTSQWIQHSVDGCIYGYSVRKVQTGTQRVAVGSHQEQTGTQQVLVKNAYDETVTTGYKCSSCGETKSK